MDNKLAVLAKIPPFDRLDVEVLQQLCGLLQEKVYSKSQLIYTQQESKLEGLDILIEGAYEAFFYDSQRQKRLPETISAGSTYGGWSLLLNKKRSIRSIVVQKGTRVWTLPRADFKALCQAYPAFIQYFTVEYGKRMLSDEYAHFVNPHTGSTGDFHTADQLYSRKIEALEPRELVSCSQDTPIFEAARRMALGKVSCLFVQDAEKKIIGYVTDITLRDKVVARQYDAADPVKEIMESGIVSISPEAYIYEAILLMFRTKTRYLLIQNGEEYLGFLSRNRLLSEQAQSPFVFIQSVKLALSDEELQRKWQQVPEIVNQLLDRGVRAEIVNQVITAVADTIAVKVIEDVIEEMGPPPARFVFMVLGSEGRKEQTLKTDQDNAIIYEDKANEQRELVRAYFLKFAERVSDRLNTIGFSYCEGGYMASNSKWTHSLSHWKRNYTQWMSESRPETVMQFSAFFDCRALYGETSLIDELRTFLDQELQKPLSMFFNYMAKNALQYEPPLTFFRSFRTFSVGTQKVFNLKKAMTPIVDLVRVYALQNRIFLTNTGERLEALRKKEIFTEEEYRELLQSYYYLMGMRLKRQAVQIIHDHAEPNNYLDPQKLTKVEQVTLKEIFKVISDFQLKIKMNFTGSIYG